MSPNGSSPVPDNYRFAIRLRWAAAQTRLRDFIPQTPFFASRLSTLLMRHYSPNVKQGTTTVLCRDGPFSLYYFTSAPHSYAPAYQSAHPSWPWGRGIYESQTATDRNGYASLRQ